MSQQYRVAAIQFEPTMFAMEQNIERLAELTEDAARQGARLIVHPEMATTGYCWKDRNEVAPFVEPIPGPTTARFAQIAARYDCYIVAGIAEIAPATGVFYNSAALIGPSGLIGVYRKAHSYISEPKWAKDGDLGIPVFDTEIGKIAIAICMDAAFPESVRIPAVLGADVVCFPTNWLLEKCPASTWIARAVESGVYFIAANRWGLERGVQFSGGSCVIDPDGNLQSIQDTGDGIAFGDVDLAQAQSRTWEHDRSDHKLEGRRPELYGAITLSTYRWQDRDFHGLYGIDPLPAGKRSNIVLAQLALESNVAANLDKIANVARTHAGSDLIVFPELALSGPVDAITAPAVAEAATGASISRLVEIARTSGTHILAGFVERDGEHLYNSAALAGPGGLVGVARKTHLTSSDRGWADPGEDLRWFDLPAGRIGVLIGHDATFPEACTCLALWGADILACPSMVIGPAVQPLGATAVPLAAPKDAGPTPAHFHLWRERAREGNMIVAFANATTPSMGWSGIFGATVEEDPRDQTFVEGGGEAVLSYEIDTTNLDTRYKTNPIRAKDLVSMRMPIWYDVLQAPVPARAPLLVTHAGDD